MGAPDYWGSFLAPHPYGAFFASLLRSYQLVPNLPIEWSMIKAVASRDLLTNVTRLVMFFWLSHSLSLNVRKCEMQVTMAVTVTTAPCETSSKTSCLSVIQLLVCQQRNPGGTGVDFLTRIKPTLWAFSTQLGALFLWRLHSSGLVPFRFA